MFGNERTVFRRYTGNEINNSLNIKQMTSFYQSAELIVDRKLLHTIQQAVV
ncbi:hypothetical protein D3C76_1468320 [compost metagenome]